MSATPSILLVEDNRSDALLYTALVRQSTGARRVTHASSLSEALQALSHGGFSAVLLDLGLPDCNDLEGVTRIAQRHPDVPVVVLTGREDGDIGERVIAAGAQDYLRKDEAKPATIGRALRHARVRKELENQVRESEQELRALFDRNPLPVFVYCLKTLALLTANEAAVEFYGRDRSQFESMTLADLCSRDDERAHMRHWLETSTAPPASLVWHHTGAGGRERVVHVHSQRLDLRGRECGLAIMLDVTARHEAKQRLADSERRYREYFEHSLVYLCEHALDGTVLAVNPAIAQAMGRPAGTLVGLSLYQLFPPHRHGLVDAYLERIAAHGEDRGQLTPQLDGRGMGTWQYHNRLLSRDGAEPVVLACAIDMTERLRAEQALLAKTAELEAVNDANPLGLFRTDAQGGLTYANRTWEAITGLAASKAGGLGWLQAVHPDDRDRTRASWTPAQLQRRDFSGAVRFLHPDGGIAWAQVKTAPILVDGNLTGYAGTLRDVTRELKAERARRRGERRLTTLADALPLLLMFLDSAGRVEFINAGWMQELRRPAAEILGHSLLDLVRGDIRDHLAMGIAAAQQGREVSVEFDDPGETAIRTWNATFIPQQDAPGSVDGIHVMLRDVTMEKARRQELVNRAERDPLTGALNREGLSVRMQAVWQEAARQQRPVGVFFLDLDGFKGINDTLGHAAGDGLLLEVATRMHDVLRTDDLLARLGGDEFVVIAFPIGDGTAALHIAHKLLAASREAMPSWPDARATRMSCSVGFHLADPADITPGQALQRADEALYAAKRAGGNQAVQWNPGMAPAPPR